MSVKDSHELKQLQTRREKAKADVDARLLDMRMAQAAYDDALKIVNFIDHQITEIQNRAAEEGREPIVTEHAMLRYIERIMGLDLNQVKGEILTDGLKLQIKTLGSGKFPIGNGYKAVVKNKSIVSIV